MNSATDSVEAQALAFEILPASSGVPARRHPCSEDDVVIHANAPLFGPIVVGANIWLMYDAPPGAHVEPTEAAA